MQVTDPENLLSESEVGFDTWASLTAMVRDQGNTVYLIGNGASASMASHIAADLAKNGRLHTEVFSDLSLITAIANDLSYDKVFAMPLSQRMKRDDMLVAISSSGCSPNILEGVEEARKGGGLVVTLSAMNPENPLRRMGDLNFYVAAQGYGEAETCHAAILHYWVDLMSMEPHVANHASSETDGPGSAGGAATG
jgi:D-sedoheptulose 7-phosphate isomerase